MNSFEACPLRGSLPLAPARQGLRPASRMCAPLASTPGRSREAFRWRRSSRHPRRHSSRRRRPAGRARRAAWCTAPHPRPRCDPAGATARPGGSPGWEAHSATAWGRLTGQSGGDAGGGVHRREAGTCQQSGGVNSVNSLSTGCPQVVNRPGRPSASMSHNMAYATQVFSMSHNSATMFLSVAKPVARFVAPRVIF